MEHDAVLKKADTPESWDHAASDFINKCLVRNPLYRLGANGSNELKSHVWFKEFDWVGLAQQKLNAPLTPLPCVNYFNEKALVQERIRQLEHNGNRYVKEVNDRLVDDFEFQKLF